MDSRTPSWEELVSIGHLPVSLKGLPSVIIVVGHYGVGKTNFSINLARDLASAGREVTIADLDIVNPFFRSSDYEHELADMGVSIVKPELAGSALDVPSLSGRVDTVIGEAQTDPGKTLVLDVGGDDVGAVALGRYSTSIELAPYAMLYVVNAYRDDRDDVGVAASLLEEIQANSHLTATAIVNNSNLQRETTPREIELGLSYAERVSEKVGLPVCATTIPELEPLEKSVDLGRDDTYIVSLTVKTPWDSV